MEPVLGAALWMCGHSRRNRNGPTDNNRGMPGGLQDIVSIRRKTSLARLFALMRNEQDCSPLPVPSWRLAELVRSNVSVRDKLWLPHIGQYTVSGCVGDRIGLAIEYAATQIVHSRHGGFVQRQLIGPDQMIELLNT